MSSVRSQVPPLVALGALSDETLALRLREGDAAAGEQLVERYARPLIQYLACLSGSVSMAGDLLQRTWLSVLDHLDRFDPSSVGGFKAWLFRIATNRTTDLWRDRSLAEPAGKPLDHSESDESFPHALAGLSEAQRQVLLLRHCGKLKSIDIANVLGCSLAAVLERMHKALFKLEHTFEIGQPAEHARYTDEDGSLLLYLWEELAPQQRIDLEQRLLVDAALQRKLQDLHEIQRQCEVRLVGLEARTRLPQSSVSSATRRVAGAMRQRQQQWDATPRNAGEGDPVSYWRRYSVASGAAVLLALIVWSVTPPRGSFDWPRTPPEKSMRNPAEGDALERPTPATTRAVDVSERRRGK